MKLEDFLEIAKKHDIEELENVVIEGDLEIEVNEQNVDISAIIPYLAVIQELQNFLYHANMAMSFVAKFGNLANVGVTKEGEKSKS